jgi:hypothetical protein
MNSESTRKSFSVDECIVSFFSDETKKKYLSNDKALVGWLRAECANILTDDDKLKAPLEWLTVNLFLEEILDKHSESDVPYSKSFFDAVVTAIKRLHENSFMTINVDVQANMTKFLGGYARQLAILRTQGKLKAAPGGDVIDYDIYRLICIYLWLNCASSVLLFHTLLLNVGTRSDNTSDLHQTHMGRKDEFTTLRVPNTKVIIL